MSAVFREIKWKSLIFAIAAIAAIMTFSFVYKCCYGLSLMSSKLWKHLMLASAKIQTWQVQHI